jgi:hypothetical protein
MAKVDGGTEYTLRSCGFDMSTTTTLDRALPSPSFNLGPVGASLTLVALGAAYLIAEVTWRQSALFLVGAAAGVVLYHAAFGFTSSWRAAIIGGSGDGLRAQMLMLAVTCAVFLPILAHGQIFGQPVRGAVAPVGISVLVGAFLFGIGMQLGGGCASGTLYTVGGGSLRMFATLAAFIAGSVIGSRHMPFWEATPAFKPISLLSRFGLAGGLAISFLLFGAVAFATLVMERRRESSRDRPISQRGGTQHENPQHERTQRESVQAQTHSQKSWLRGPWSLVAGALGLAAVNVATLTLSGRPWGVTFAFALWGTKTLSALGMNVAAWPYWQTASNAAALRASVLTDVTSVMDFGIILGALLAAGLAGRFAPLRRVPPRSMVAAILGGLLLGYGARIAYGCNIGAYFSGIASSSLHGWVWFAAAFAGNGVGTRIRPFFGLTV